MKVNVTRGKTMISLCYGFGSALLLTAALGGFVLGDAMPVKPVAGKSDLVAPSDEAATRQAINEARERLMKQEGLTDSARRVRLTALDDSMDAYVSMMDRLSQIRERDPTLDSAEAKTLLKSASAIVERVSEQEIVSGDDNQMLDLALRGVGVLGFFSLFSGIALTFPVARGILRPFKALAAFVSAFRAA